MNKNPKFKDISGQKFGRLTALEMMHVDERRRAVWRCACECGREALVAAVMLRNGHNKSCGCMWRENISRGSLRHGESKSPAWRAWIRMRMRCTKESMQRFKNYGGRGIAVCERWQQFENFLADMGQPPSGYTLERIDVNGDYTPDNCKWISPDAQYSNTTRTIYVSLHGREFPFRDLVRASGLNYETAYARLKQYKWPVERIFASIRPEDLPD